MMMAVLLTSCQDIAPLHEQVSFLDKRADNIEKWLAEIKSEHQRLDALLSSVIDKDYVTSVEISYDEDSSYVVSYTVHFSKSAPITIMAQGSAGKDGMPGADGKPGKPGNDGKPGRNPYISVGEKDGAYYWKADGAWITDDAGKYVPVVSGVGPVMKAEGEDWYVSFDNGRTWVPVDPLTDGIVSVTDVLQGESEVTFVLNDGSSIRIPYKTSVTFNLSKEGCLDAVAGASYVITYSYKGVQDAKVTLLANDYIGSCNVEQTTEGGTGRIYYTISEEHDVSRQKIMVHLNYSGGTMTKVLTFRKAGVLDISPVEPISSQGGECVLSIVMEGYSYSYREVTQGGDWLKFVSTSSAGAVYEAAPNLSEKSRYAEITVTVRNQYLSNLFTKKIRIVQFGTGGLPGHLDYVGSWTMTGSDRISGGTFSRKVRIVEGTDMADTYLIYGLSSGTGESTPVTAVYDDTDGKLCLRLNQERLPGTDVGIYAVGMNGDRPSRLPEGESFRFTLSRNTMTADMTSERSFMFMDENGKVASGDNSFYYNVVLQRDGVTGTYDDGECVMINEADERYTPLNLVILGDGYQKIDLKEGGKFERTARSVAGSFFAVEPFASYKDRFDVYMVPYASEDEGPDVTSSGKVSDTYFSSVCAGGGNTLVTCDYDTVLDAVRKLGLTEDNNNLYRTVVILLVNTDEQSGSCWYIKGGRTDASDVGDGLKSMAIAMIAANTTGTNGLVRHEAGGHGFGRLADEYNWGGEADDARKSSLLEQQEKYGFYLNVTADTDGDSPWAHFIGLEGYDEVGYFEGAWGCSKGLYRPTSNSIMLNNQGEFNAPSRELIFKRIILQSEGAGSYTFDRFLEYDRKNL